MDTYIHINNKLEFRDELLEGDLSSYPQFASIKNYLFLFQKYYFKYDVRIINEFINFLFQYKEELDKIDPEFLLSLMDKDLLRLTIPTRNIMDDLIILIDKYRIDFNKNFIDATTTVADALDEYNKDFFNKDFYKYYLEYKRVYGEYKKSNNPRYGEMSWDAYMMSRFILAYAYYYEVDPSVISAFFNNFIDNYDVIKAHFGLNNLNNDRGDINIFKQSDYLIKYVLSFGKQKRKVIL